jgi:hypothetical protein
MLRKVLPLLVVPCLAIAYGLLVRPETGQYGIPCLWKTLFGVQCPGCGLTRAWAFLLRGEWRRAAQMNWLIFPVVLIYSGHLAVAWSRVAAKKTLHDLERRVDRYA